VLVRAFDRREAECKKGVVRVSANLVCFADAGGRTDEFQFALRIHDAGDSLEDSIVVERFENLLEFVRQLVAPNTFRTDNLAVHEAERLVPVQTSLFGQRHADDKFASRDERPGSLNRGHAKPLSVA
jgi:hypothetical protein